MIAYKVVFVQFRVGGKEWMESIVAKYSPWRTRYQAGVRTTPPVKGTKLFVFKELADARNFSSDRYIGGEIWECEAENMEPAERVGFPDRHYQFWEGKDWASTLPPRGTFLADAVTLTKKVA